MKSKMPDDYQIPDDQRTGKMDAAFLRTMLGLRAELGDDEPELPLAVRQAHYDVSSLLSILGATGNGVMDPTQLVTVVMFARLNGVEIQPDEETVELFPADQAESGQKVVIHWQNKDQPAHFIEKNGKKILVLVSGKERNMRPDLVRFPEDGEFPEVASNINEPVEVQP
jgi:hypothetical protein